MTLRRSAAYGAARRVHGKALRVKNPGRYAAGAGEVSPLILRSEPELSMTRTQSPLAGGVNCCGVSVGKLPIWVAAPVLGLYHQAIIVLPARQAPLTVIARDEGK
jgi:hypothetical protein